MHICIHIIRPAFLILTLESPHDTATHLLFCSVSDASRGSRGWQQLLRFQWIRSSIGPLRFFGSETIPHGHMVPAPATQVTRSFGIQFLCGLGRPQAGAGALHQIHRNSCAPTPHSSFLSAPPPRPPSSTPSPLHHPTRWSGVH